MAFENRRLTSLIIYDLSGNPILRINKTEGLIVLDPTSASYIQVLPSSNQSRIRVYPGTLSGQTPQYGQIYADFDPLAPANFIRGRLNIQSPAPTPTADPAIIQMLSQSVDELDVSAIVLNAQVVTAGNNFSVTEAGVVRIVSNIVCTSEAGLTFMCVANDTTTSVTFVNMAGVNNLTSFQFEKMYDETRVRLDMAGGWFCTNTLTDAEFALRIDGVDYPLAFMGSSVGTDRLTYNGFDYVPGGTIAAGTYTVQARWRRPAGAGTLSRGAGDDMLCISAREVDA